MSEVGPILGELQGQIMPALWRLEAGTVEQVRAALPRRYRGAYTTVQTVLNRLADRGLVTREKVGNAFVYRPRLSETEFLSRSIQGTLAAASSETRQTVLAELIGGLPHGELDQLQEIAQMIEQRRRA